jgi:hypothetical protein
VSGRNRAAAARRPRRYGSAIGWTVVLGLALLAAVLVPLVRYALTPSEAHQAAAGLRDSVVYVAPGAEDVLDEDRVRQVIGDRPIVVAVLAASYTGDHLDACEHLARRMDRTIVLTYLASEPGGYPAYCPTSRFPEPQVTEGIESLEVDAVDNWLWRVARVAQQASRFRVDERRVDRTPEIEEYVLAFDALAVREYPDGVPTRAAGADPVTSLTVAGRLLAVLAVIGTVYVALRLAATHVGGRLARRRELQHRRLALDARLSEVAGRVLHVEPGPQDGRRVRRQAALAERYLAALAAFEAARTPEELDEAERALDAVDEQAVPA